MATRTRRARTWCSIVAPLVLGLLVVTRAAASPETESVGEAQRARVRRSVELVVFGDFEPRMLSAIERGLREQLQVSVAKVKRSALPQSAYYAPRKRYRAEKLLDFMLRGSGRASRLGLTEVDISTTKGKRRDWGVFGAAYVADRVAVISTHRLLRNARGEAHGRFRVVSTAVHEVGHMLGLDHCAEPRCVMNDAHGSIRTVDESTGELGPVCRQRLDRLAPLESSARSRRADGGA